MKRIRNIGFYSVMILLLLQSAVLKGQTDTLCFNDTILYNIPGPAGSEYDWQVSGGSIIYTSSNNDSVIVVWNESPGLHSLQVTQRNENGCTNDPQVLELFIYRPLIDLGGDIELCEGSGELLVMDPGYQEYLWNNQPGTNEFVVNTGGIITLEVKDSHGCWATDSITVTEMENPEPEFTISIDTINRSVTVSNESDSTWQFYWEFGDGIVSVDYNPGIHVYSEYGTYFITLTATAGNCSGAVTTEVTFTETITSDFIALFEGCAPVEVTFMNQSTGAESYYWDFGNGNYSDEENPGTIYSEPGTYEVSLHAVNGSDEVISRKTIIINEAPIAGFTVSPSEANTYEDINFINMSSNAVQYAWDFGDGETSEQYEPVHSYSSDGLYDIILWVWSETGCKDSLMVNNAITITQSCRILFPNGFIPNKNGPGGGYYNPAQIIDNNEIFHPIYEDIVEYEIRIYNRWGELVFTSKDIEMGWDGYYKGKLASQDTYIFEAKSRCSTGQEISTVGSVSLIY